MAKDALDKGTGVIDPTYLPGTRLVRAFSTIDYHLWPAKRIVQASKWVFHLASNDKQALRIASQLVTTPALSLWSSAVLNHRSFDIGQRG